MYMPLTGAAVCFNCPNNSVILNQQTGSESVLDCTCRSGYFNPYGEPGRPCFRCPEGSKCDGRLTQPYPKRGFWQLGSHRFKPVYVQCKPAELCMEGGFCRPGYRGNLCADCKEGYYRRGIRCRPCSSGIKLSLQASIGFVVTLFSLMCLGLYFLASAEALQRSATVYVLLYFVQSLDHFDGLTMPWPEEWQIFFSVMSVFNFDLQQARLDCFPGWGGLRNTILLQLSLPLVALSIYIIIVFLYMMMLWIARMRRLVPPVEALLRLQRSPKLSRMIDRSIGAYIALLSLMYPMLCKTTLSIFACRNVDALLGHSFLDILPSLECYGDEHRKLLVVGVVGLFVYLLGIPVFFFYLLILGVRRQSLDHPVFRQRFGSLYLRYERKFWWWEMVVMFRRMLTLLVLIMASRYELLQTAMMLVVFFFAVVLQDNARPYDREMVDNFEFLQLLACHFILLLGVIYDGAGKTLLAANTCDSTNGTIVSEECTHEENKKELYKFWQWLASFSIVVMLLSALGCGSLTIWVQIQSTVKKRLKERDKTLEDEAHAKVAFLLELSGRVLNEDVMPATKDWLLKSTPSEREYFKHLMVLLDQNYDDWVALQHKNMRDFLERAQEQLVDNLRFLIKFVSTVMQILCCLRVRKKKVNQFSGKPIAQQGKVTKATRNRFGRKAKVAKNSSEKAAEVTPPGAFTAEDKEDDLVEAYLMSRGK